MDVVRERVERAPRGEVEPGVVPQAGEEPLLDLAAVQWEAHMRAAVVDRGRLAVAPKDADGLGPDLAGEDARSGELIDCPDRRALVLLSHVGDLHCRLGEPYLRGQGSAGATTNTAWCGSA